MSEKDIVGSIKRIYIYIRYTLVHSNSCGNYSTSISSPRHPKTEVWYLDPEKPYHPNTVHLRRYDSLDV